MSPAKLSLASLAVVILSLATFSTAFVAPPAFAQCRNVLLTPLHLASIDVSNPSQEEATEMGIREWPQQLKKGTWSEDVADGQTMIRYVLDGKGTVVTDDGKRMTVGPGALLEVFGPTSLTWETPNEMIVLTPGFEEGGKLLGVAAALVILCGAMIAGVGS